MSILLWTRNLSTVGKLRRPKNVFYYADVTSLSRFIGIGRSFSTTTPRLRLQGLFRELYERQCIEGGFREDGRQKAVVEVLDRLFVSLLRSPCPPVPSRPSKQKGSFFSRLFGGASNAAAKTNVVSPAGVYLFGGVGTGKTMLMDLFLDAIVEAGALVAPSPSSSPSPSPPSSSSSSSSIYEWSQRCRRVHFHDFMLDVHERAHKWKNSETGGKGKGGDPFPDIAADLAGESALLCFDEFQVTDVADALIIHRLFDNLFSHGITMVATSNRPPEDLYKNGIQRQMFLPFIDLLRKKCVVHNIGSERDYRRYHFEKAGANEEVISLGTADEGEGEGDVGKEKKNKGTIPSTSHRDHPYFFTFDDKTRKEFRLFFEENETKRMIGREGDTSSSPAVSAAKPKTVRVMMGRKLQVPLAVGTSAFFNFEDLCSTAVGAADFIAIANSFSHVYIRGVPSLSLERREELRRFITFVDVMYERRVQLVVHAESSLAELFRADELSGEDRIGGRVDAETLDALKVEDTGKKKKEDDEEIFAFDRTASRLIEMQTTHYSTLAAEEERRRAAGRR